MKPIYLDYAATTPVDERVFAKMQGCFTQEGIFGNPASHHYYGHKAMLAIDTAREAIAAVIGAETSEIIFTSGATESNNLALKGAAQLYQQRGKHIITMRTEHKAVLDVCQQLERQGFSVTYLQPKNNGLLDREALLSALTSETILVSIMHVNNETGVIQDIHNLAQITADQGILLHVDAAQSIGKISLDVNKTPIDLISLSAHKAYGPKGMGALYLRKKPRVKVAPLIHGGGHEQGMRSGTLATHQIVGMGAAFELIQSDYQFERIRVRELQQKFIKGLEEIQCFKMNVNIADIVPHILSVRFEGKIAKALLSAVPNIAASTASACAGVTGSYVLRAMGYTPEVIQSTIRFSFGRFTTDTQITLSVDMIKALFSQ